MMRTACTDTLPCSSAGAAAREAGDDDDEAGTILRDDLADEPVALRTRARGQAPPAANTANAANAATAGPGAAGAGPGLDGGGEWWVDEMIVEQRWNKKKRQVRQR